jgi:tripartite-type tricarboxylate transporter receptor subunit TctC
MMGWRHAARRAAFAVTITAALFATTTAAHAQSNYPGDRPIHLIVPLAAGSAVDAAARIVTQKMGTNMGTSFVVENIDGASGQIGANRVAKAAPDGYTIGAFNDSIMTMVPNLQKNLPWDILKDFEPISLAAVVDWGLVVTPGAPYNSVSDVIAAAKANPNKINYGSGGVGSPQHIAMALFMSQAGIQMNHVPYKGATQAALGVAGGDVTMAFEGLATVTSLIAGKRVKLVAVSTKAKLPQYPDVPTVSEAGLAGFQFESWFTLMAPAGTPKAIVDKLQQEAVKAMKDPDVIAQLKAQSLTPRGSTPEELAALTRSQLERYRKAMADAGIKPQ